MYDFCNLDLSKGKGTFSDTKSVYSISPPPLFYLFTRYFSSAMASELAITYTYMEGKVAYEYFDNSKNLPVECQAKIYQYSKGKKNSKYL